MRKLTHTLVLASGLILVACNQQNMLAPAPHATASNDFRQENGGYSGETPEMKQAGTAKPSPNMMLAYRYYFGFSIPAKNLEAVTEKALQSCRVAGMGKCRIVTSSLNKQSEDYLSASIELRVEPEWFKTYQESLKLDSKDGGGKLTNSTVSSEDLTIAISDSGAKLGALKTLRTRLLSLLEKEGSRVKDLVEVERELARVQGEIEGTTARLRVLKTRVNMSEVHLNYETKSVAASRSSFSSIGYALNNFLETVAGGVSGIIFVIAYLLPWLIFGIPLLWLLRKLWRRRKTKNV